MSGPVTSTPVLQVFKLDFCFISPVSVKEKCVRNSEPVVLLFFSRKKRSKLDLSAFNVALFSRVACDFVFYVDGDFPIVNDE